MGISESITDGMRLTHTTHGDGKIHSLQDRVNPKTKAVDTYATVVFSSVNGKVSWSSLIHGQRVDSRNTDTSLTLLIPVSDIQNGSQWFIANDYGDLSDMIIDIERLGTKNSSISPIHGNESAATQIVTFAKNLERAELTPESDPINMVKIIVDWCVERALSQVSLTNSRSVATKSSEIAEWIGLIEDRKFWSLKCYPALPEVVRVGAEKVMVSVAGLISCEHDVEMTEAARILTSALENRVANTHLRGFYNAQSRLQAQTSRIGVN